MSYHYKPAFCINIHHSLQQLVLVAILRPHHNEIVLYAVNTLASRFHILFDWVGSFVPWTLRDQGWTRGQHDKATERNHIKLCILNLKMNQHNGTELKAHFLGPSLKFMK